MYLEEQLSYLSNRNLKCALQSIGEIGFEIQKTRATIFKIN